MQQPLRQHEQPSLLPRRAFGKRSGSGIFYNMWGQLRDKFNLPLPNVAITCGWPSRKCRGRASNRAPGEIIVQEWKGDAIEKAFVSVHPERFENVEQVALSVLYSVGNEVYGSRRNLGATTLGVSLNKESGHLEYLKDEKGAHAKTILNGIIKQLGPLPVGFAEMPEPKAVERSRQRKYACTVCGQIIRAATDTLEAMHSVDRGSFALQLPKAAKPAEEKAAASLPPEYAHVPAAQAALVAKAVKEKGAQTSAGRMFQPAA